MLLISFSEAHRFSMAHLLRQILADEINNEALQIRITNLRIKFGVDKDDLKFVAMLLWFGYLWQKALRGRMPSASWDGRYGFVLGASDSKMAEPT